MGGRGEKRDGEGGREGGRKEGDNPVVSMGYISSNTYTHTNTHKHTHITKELPAQQVGE